MKIKSTKKHRSKDKFTIKQDYEYAGEDFWNWSIWIESTNSGLDKIDNVIYNLHYTFPNPVVTIKTRDDQFRLNAGGWGTFVIYAHINFEDDTILELEHELELEYPE